MSSNFKLFGCVVDLPLDVCSSSDNLRTGAVNVTGITSSLDSQGTSSLYSCNSNGTKRKWNAVNGVALGLGLSPCSSVNSKMSSTIICTMSSEKDSTEEESSANLGFDLNLDSGHAFISKKLALETGASVDIGLSLSTRPSVSVITSTRVSDQHQNIMEGSVLTNSLPIFDEKRSTLSQWELSSHLVPSLFPSDTSSSSHFLQKFYPKVDPFLVGPNISKQITENSVACASKVTNPQQRISSTKNCHFPGCGKGARGASGLCIAHGGGRRCQKAGCYKGAEGKTVYCKAHGGGRRCQYLGCTKSAEGRTDYCIAHGGGQRCSKEGCPRAARGKSGLCIRHGGGKRCQMENCTKSAEGRSGLCISHGGGRRCQYPACTKGAQGSTKFCKAHGGGKRCTVLGCTKGAEGSTAFCKGHGGGKRCSFQVGGVCPKSVHGGTQFCIAHGGGKRCAVPECTKSARGRTDFCVRHGGGKRCNFEGCGKSAQGSTNFCKAHGGSKQSSSQFDETASIHMMQDHCVRVSDTPRPTMTHFPALVKTEKLSESAFSGFAFSEVQNDGISPPVWNGVDALEYMHPVIPFQSDSVAYLEGRVHGGCLMSMLSGC